MLEKPFGRDLRTAQELNAMLHRHFPESSIFRIDHFLGKEAIENLLADLNESYNAKQGKAWGYFHEESGAYPFSGWLGQYLEGNQDFTAFSRQAVEHLQKLMEESNLSTGGHVLFAHYQQGMTDYLAIALLHHSEGVTVTESLDVAAARHLVDGDAVFISEGGEVDFPEQQREEACGDGCG